MRAAGVQCRCLRISVCTILFNINIRIFVRAAIVITPYRKTATAKTPTTRRPPKRRQCPYSLRSTVTVRQRRDAVRRYLPAERTCRNVRRSAVIRLKITRPSSRARITHGLILSTILVFSCRKSKRQNGGRGGLNNNNKKKLQYYVYTYTATHNDTF